MRVLVLCFAQTRELLGSPSLTLELAEDATVASMLKGLKKDCPALESVALRFAVNRDFASLEQKLKEGDEIALIPPVAGG